MTHPLSRISHQQFRNRHNCNIFDLIFHYISTAAHVFIEIIRRAGFDHAMLPSFNYLQCGFVVYFHNHVTGTRRTAILSLKEFCKGEKNSLCSLLHLILVCFQGNILVNVR